MTRSFNPPRKAAKHYWTAEELKIVRERYPDMATADLAREMGIPINSMHSIAYLHGIKKSRVYLSDQARKSAHGTKSRFKPGQVPWNKGIPFNSGGRSAETRFKPGTPVHNHRPVGSTRINVEGYVEIKIEEPRKWGQLHREVWKKEHGSYPPAGYAVAFKDGNKQNCVIENMELITRAELCLRNSYHNYGPEISKLVQLRGAITRQINKRSKNV